MLALLLQMAVFAPGTFFCYPHKLLLNLFYGSSYERSYKHFRVGHYSSLNLWLHLGCLSFQLTCNFALLASLDELLLRFFPGAPASLLSIGTAIFWALTLLYTSAPPAAKCLACLAISAGVTVRHVVLQHWHAVALLHVLLEPLSVWYVARVLLDTHITLTSILTMALCRVGLFGMLLWYAEGALGSPHACTWTHLGLMLILMGTSIVKVKGDALCESVGSALGWTVAVLTGSPVGMLVTSSYVGGTLQGVAHEVTREKATLPGLTKVADELSHTTFFPALLFHAMHQTFFC